MTYKYTGKGFLVGVPSRDLTDEEAEKFGVKLIKGSGLYIHIGGEPKKSKRLRSGEPVTEPAEEQGE